MDVTNHSRGSTLQSLSPDTREDLEHELRPEALASIAREENAEASTNTTHAAVSPKPRAETASTGLVPPHESSTHTDRAVRTEASVDDKSSLAIDFEGEPGGFLEAPKKQRPTKAPPKHLDRVRRFYGSFPTSRCVEAMVNGIFYRVHGSVVQGAPAVAQTRCVMVQGVAASCEANMYLLRAIARRRADRGLCVIEVDNVGIGRSMAPRARKEYTIQRMADDVAAVVKHVWEEGAEHHVIGHSMGGMLCRNQTCVS